LPREVCDARLQKGATVARENASGVVVLKWKDKRDVLMLSTSHSDACVRTGKRARNGEEIIKPEAVLQQQ